MEGLSNHSTCVGHELKNNVSFLKFDYKSPVALAITHPYWNQSDNVIVPSSMLTSLQTSANMTTPDLVSLIGLQAIYNQSDL